MQPLRVLMNFRSSPNQSFLVWHDVYRRESFDGSHVKIAQDYMIRMVCLGKEKLNEFPSLECKVKTCEDQMLRTIVCS